MNSLFLEFQYLPIYNWVLKYLHHVYKFLEFYTQSSTEFEKFYQVFVLHLAKFQH